MHTKTNQSINQVRHKLGIPGKTKEGYDCYVHYDKDCYPVKAAKADLKAPSKPFCHPYDPKCSKFARPPSVAALKSGKDGIIMPDPNCDPELDYDCRLRRAEPAAGADEPAEEEATYEPAKMVAVPRFEHFLKGVIRHHK